MIEKLCLDFAITARMAGMSIMPRQKCLELLALCYAFAGGNADWTHTKITNAVLLAQGQLGILGGESVAPDVVVELKQLISEIIPNGVMREPANPLPVWAIERLGEYKIRLPE